MAAVVAGCPVGVPLTTYVRDLVLASTQTPINA